jgi:ribosomal protein S18 acetylase RimI-like enzyme
MIRKAQMPDLTAVQACIREAYEPEAAEIGVRLAPLDTNYAEAIERREVHLCLDVNGTLLGLILFHVEGRIMHLDNVAVPASNHGRGIGRKLIDYCEEVARRLQLQSVELYTNQKLLRNIAIYEHLGYVVTDRRLDEGFQRIFFRKVL